MSNLQKGILAAQSGFDLPLDVYESRAGYYIGTFSPEAGPISRESVEYYPTHLEAKKALVNGLWTQRLYP